MTITEVLPGAPETVPLYGWTEWTPSTGETIRARLFGELLKRSAWIVEEFQSDLFHDAQWLRDNVNGPCEFLFMARRHGTNIAESAEVHERISSREPRTLWHVALTEERGEWSVTFTVLVRVTE